MKVHVIKKITIEEFYTKHARSKNSFEIWYNQIKYADWNDPEDILRTFGTADLLGKGSDRIVFDIRGNNYRMICKYWFGLKKVHLYIKWIGTHNEYNQLCKKNGQYTINSY